MYKPRMIVLAILLTLFLVSCVAQANAPAGGNDPFDFNSIDLLITVAALNTPIWGTPIPSDTWGTPMYTATPVPPTDTPVPATATPDA